MDRCWIFCNELLLFSKLNQQLSEIDEALRGLGSSPIDMSCEASQGELMLSILTQFSNNFSNAIDGKGFDVSRLELSKLSMSRVSALLAMDDMFNCNNSGDWRWCKDRIYLQQSVQGEGRDDLAVREPPRRGYPCCDRLCYGTASFAICTRVVI